MLLAMVAWFDLELEQLDVKTAFLHGELEGQIFMHQEGFVIEGKEDHVCRETNSDCKIAGYSDSNFVGDLDRRRSLTSFAFTLSGSAIS